MTSRAWLTPVLLEHETSSALFKSPVFFYLLMLVWVHGKVWQAMANHGNQCRVGVRDCNSGWVHWRGQPEAQLRQRLRGSTALSGEVVEEAG